MPSITLVDHEFFSQPVIENCNFCSLLSLVARFFGSRRRSGEYVLPTETTMLVRYWTAPRMDAGPTSIPTGMFSPAGELGRDRGGGCHRDGRRVSLTAHVAVCPWMHLPDVTLSADVCFTEESL